MDRRLRQTALLGILAGLIAFPVGANAQTTPDMSVSGKVAILRALDKVTARHTDLVIPVGDTLRFGTINITVDYCRRRPPIEPPETYVLVNLQESAPERDPVTVFDGWMLASLPGLNPVEHPVYDLWAVGCLMTDEEVARYGSDDTDTDNE